MTIKINIIKTADGYEFRNAETGKLLGTVRQGRNTTKWHWIIPGDYGCGSEEQALYEIKETLAQRAAYLGLETRFINIKNNK